jgi:hypothetical protein
MIVCAMKEQRAAAAFFSVTYFIISMMMLIFTRTQRTEKEEIKNLPGRFDRFIGKKSSFHFSKQISIEMLLCAS